MSKKSGTSAGNGGVISADDNPDEVSNALGLDDATDTDDEDLDDDATDDGGDDDEEDGDDEPTLADVLAELRALKRDNATLKREAAAARVASKAKPKPAEGGAAGSETGETVEQAAERGKEEARLEYGIELAGASIRAALTGIIPEADLDDYIDDLRLERYVGDDGKPDREAIKALKERQAKITRRKSSRTGHGRSTDGGGEKSKGDLMGETMKALGL